MAADTDVADIGEDVPADQDSQYLEKAIQRERVERQLNTGDTDPRVTQILSQPKPAVSWRAGAEVLNERSGYASTFGDQADRDRYAGAIASGATPEQALQVGDNGIGADDLGRISTPYVYGVAIPRNELERYFGYDPQQWRRARVAVRVGDINVNVPIIDEGPGNKAQAHGVVTDLSARLAEALKANGMEPSQINILRDAGPDYMSDRANWDDEQKRIRNQLGVLSSWQDGRDADQEEVETGGPSPYAKSGPYVTTLSSEDEAKFKQWVKDKNVPWQDEENADYDMRGFWKALTSGDPRAKQERSQFDQQMHFPDIWKTPYHKTFSNESMYATPDAPHWEGDRLIDKSGRLVGDETPGAKLDWRSGTDVSKGWKSGDIATGHPVAQAAGMGATSWITKIWDQAKDSMAKAAYGSLQARTTDEAIFPDPELRDRAEAIARGDPYTKEIQEIQMDPFLNEQQKAEGIDAVKKAQAREQVKLLAQIAPAKHEFLKAEAQVKADKPNWAESLAGQALPYLWYGVAGSAAPLIIAQQATAETYADMLDPSVQKLRKDHPDWSDSKVMIEALKATQAAAQASGGAQIAMASVDIPVVGSLVSRIVQKIGIGAATMEIANSLAEVQKNMAVREHVDPKQDILGQLRSLDFHLTNLGVGGAFSVGHALAEIGRPTTKPIDQRIADAQKIEQNLTKPTVQPEMKAHVVEENGETGSVPYESGAERPETDDTGRPGEGERETQPTGREREPGAERVRVQPVDQRKWSELKPEEIQTKMMEWRAAFDAAWVKYAPFFKALRIPMAMRDHGRIIGVQAKGQGVITLEVDPMVQAEHWHKFQQVTGHTDLAEITDVMLRHELIHGAWMDAWRQQWVKDGSQGDFGKYMIDKTDEINQGMKMAIAEARANHNEGLASYLEQAAIASAQTYSPTASANPFSRAAEFIRQMVEARHVGVLTEDYFAPAYNRFLDVVKHSYETARAYLTSLAKSIGLTGGKGLDPLRKAINDTEQRLAEIGFLEDREPVTPEDMLPEESRAGINPIEDKLDLLGLDDTPTSRAFAERALRADESGKETLLVSAVKDTRNGNIVSHELGHLMAMRELLGRAPKKTVPSWTEVPGGLEREEEGRKPDYVEYGYLTNTGRFVTSPMDLARQIEAGEDARASWPGEELFEANRDVIKRLPHTEELIQKLYDYDDLDRDNRGKHAVLTKMLKVWKRKNPGLSREVDAIGRYVERYHKLPPSSAEAMLWMQHANNGLRREYGDQMRQGGFLVLKSDGSTRPFIGAPGDVMPFGRIKRPDVTKILRGNIYERGTKTFTKAAADLYKEGQHTIDQNTGKPYFEKPEDLEAWAKVWKSENKLRPLISILERAREVEYPSFFYTYSPESMINSLFWQGRELARLMAFGQKLKLGDKDLFDRTKEAISNDLSLSEVQRKRGEQAIEALQKSIYGLNQRRMGIRIWRGATAAGFAGSPHTSAKIGLSMLWNIPTLRGLARTLYAIDQITSPFSAPAMFENLRRMGLKQDRFITMGDDPYTINSAEKIATNIFSGELRLAGHAFVQDVAKAVTYKVSRMWLESAIRKLRADPQLLKSDTRIIAGDIKRRGIDPREFMKSVVPERLKERFSGEDVQQLQTAYRPHDYPAFWSTEWGSVMVTFGHWAYDRARVIARDAVIPMVQAYRAGDYPLMTRYFGRLLGISLVSAGGASEAWRQVNELFGRQDNTATNAEILKALADRNPDAFHMILSRLTQDITLSPVIGLYSDVIQRFQGVSRGTSDLVRTFNPFQPASVAYLALFQDIANAWSQQGHRLSDRQMWYYAGQLVSIGRGYYDLAEAGMHIPLPGTAEARGHREYAWVRSRVSMFYHLHPEFDKTPKGLYPSSAHASYLQNISEDLLAGNVQKAKDEIHRYHVEQKLTDKQLKQSLESSLRAHEPIPGGKAGASFRVWAKKTLPEDEWERMKEINKRYLEAAHEAGVPIKP